jgi:hypothetical protein
MKRLFGTWTDCSPHARRVRGREGHRERQNGRFSDSHVLRGYPVVILPSGATTIRPNSIEYSYQWVMKAFSEYTTQESHVIRKRLSKYYEHLPRLSEAFVYLASIHLTVHPPDRTSSFTERAILNSLLFSSTVIAEPARSAQLLQVFGGSCGVIAPFGPGSCGICCSRR